MRIKRIAGGVPSRAADNLFWLGRYLERAEATLRLVRALGTSQRDPGKGTSTRAACGRANPAAAGDLGGDRAGDRAQPAKIVAEALQAKDKFGSALSLVKSAQRTATSLRERLSPDAWQVITEMAERLALEVEDDDAVVSAAELTLQELASFAGLAQENMNRAAGWRFLEMGRRVERAINTVRFARQFAYDEAGDEDLDILLTLVDCQITYRSRYLVGPLLAPVRDLVVLDPYNPRSVAFQVAALNEHIASLPSAQGARPDRAAAAPRGRAAGDADDGGSGQPRYQDAVLAGAGPAQPRRRHRLALFSARTQCQPAREADGPRVIYDIRHVTTYTYESPVSFARCSLRLEPRTGDGQQLVSHSVEIRPKPADRTLRRDFFGTQTESILIETAHRNLRIDSRSRVSVSRQAPGRDAPSPSWESVRDVAFEATSLGPESPIGYVFASPLVPVQRPVTAYAAASFPPGSGILAGAVDLMHRIRTEFKYDPKATVISTPLKEVFEKRHGVCQDFAHVMIAGLRGLGLPAAYVTAVPAHHPAAGQAAPARRRRDPCLGLAVVRRGIGWIGFDPTNDLLVDNDHIMLAVGRDFSDVSPVDGIIVGSRKQKLAVAVDVLLVE